jgi:hypothetical protein
MEVVLLDKQDYNNLVNEIAQLKDLVLSIAKPDNKLNKDWLPLKKFLNEYDISNSCWYDTYRKKIKHRNDGSKIWVHKPSMEKYLMEKSIN